MEKNRGQRRARARPGPGAPECGGRPKAEGPEEGPSAEGHPVPRALLCRRAEVCGLLAALQPSGPRRPSTLPRGFRPSSSTLHPWSFLAPTPGTEPDPQGASLTPSPQLQEAAPSPARPQQLPRGAHLRALALASQRSGLRVALWRPAGRLQPRLEPCAQGLWARDRARWPSSGGRKPGTERAPAPSTFLSLTSMVLCCQQVSACTCARGKPADTGRCAPGTPGGGEGF